MEEYAREYSNKQTQMTELLLCFQAKADKQRELLARCGHALASLDNSYPNELDVIDAGLLDELAKELADD